MKTCRTALLILSASLASAVLANEMEEVIVTSSFIDQTLSEIENPLHVVSGADVSEGGVRSLGESLDNLLGIASADFGSAVGQPIIRGLSGNRVKILSNMRVVRDVSGLGADHINDLDLNNIDQIEVVKGPSSLLYANGTIGGIINVVDRTIAKKDFEESELILSVEGQSVNDGYSYDVSYQNNIAGLNFSGSYKDSNFDDFDIPTGASVPHEGEHDRDLSYLPNSDYDTSSKKFGVSKTGDWGYFGISYNNVESEYGIPFHGDDHEGDDHEGERIFSTTDSDAFNLEGSYVRDIGWLKSIDYYFRYSDYSLLEQHAEGDEEHAGADHAEEGPTFFENEAIEYGAIFDLTNEFFSQKVVLNFIEEDVSVIGEEAFLNPTEDESITFGYYLSKHFDFMHVDFGVRHDRISRKGSVSNEEDLESFDKDINNTSFALSFGREINDFIDLHLSFAHVERAPSAVELFMNGPHLATGRFEVGDPNLETERSNNIDVSLNYERQGFFGYLAYYRNEVDEYIYLRDEEHDDDGPHEDLIFASYLQKDAWFEGYEVEVGKVFELARGDLTLSFSRDSVRGKFKGGNNIPRIVPPRNIYSVSYASKAFKIGFFLKDVEKQQDVVVDETPTNGYEMLDFKLTKTFQFNAGNKLKVSVFANNILDHVARNHASFVKDEVSLPGRNFGANFSVRF